MKEQEFFKLLDDISDDILTETDKYRKSETSDTAGNCSNIAAYDTENEISGEVVHIKKTGFKRTAFAFVALAAAAAGVVIGVSHFEESHEKITLSEQEGKVTESDCINEEITESQDTEKSEEKPGDTTEYSAEVVIDLYPVNTTLLAGSYDGSCIFINGKKEKSAVLRSLKGSYDERKIYNENGQEFKIIGNAVQYGNNILVSGATDTERNTAEICVYGSTLDEVICGIYPDGDEALSCFALSGDTVYYISQTEKFFLNSFNINTHEKKQICFDADNSNYDYVSYLGILKSGDICVLGKKYTSDKCYTDLVVFDSELDLLKKENIHTGSSFLQTTQVVSYADDCLTVYYEESNDTAGYDIKAKVLYCDEEDNFTAGEETGFSCRFSNPDLNTFFMYPLTNGKYGLIYGTEDGIFGFDPVSGESEELSEYLTERSYVSENSSTSYFYLDGALCYVKSRTDYVKSICKDPYGNDEICSVKFRDDLQNSYKIYCDNGKLYLFVYELLKTDYRSLIHINDPVPRKYVIYEIDLATGEYTESEMTSEISFGPQVFYADENYYILAACISGKVNSEYTDGSICIFSHDGELLKNISAPEKAYSFLDIFRTADNKIIMTGSGKDGYSACTLNADEGTIELIDEENPYIYSLTHKSGDEYYSFYYLDEETIYGVKETPEGKLNEKVAGLSGMKEQDIYEYIGPERIAWSDDEKTWYAYVGGRLFRGVKG